MITVISLMKTEKLKFVLSCFHSIMTYGIIFWGNSVDKKLSILFQEEKNKK
jgi:hypothetical protein